MTTVAASGLRPRLAVSLVFVVLGATQGGWMARIPAIRDQVGVDTARWGLLSSSSAAGDLVAVVLITVLIGRVSTRLVGPGGRHPGHAARYARRNAATPAVISCSVLPLGSGRTP